MGACLTFINSSMLGFLFYIVMAVSFAAFSYCSIGFIERRTFRFSIGPGVHLNTVVGTIENKGVVGDIKLVEESQELADIHVVLDHTCTVLVQVLVGDLVCQDPVRFTDMGAKMHACAVPLAEPGFAGSMLLADPFDRAVARHSSR